MKARAMSGNADHVPAVFVGVVSTLLVLRTGHTAATTDMFPIS